MTLGQWGFGSRDKITAHVDFPVDGLDLTGWCLRWCACVCGPVNLWLLCMCLGDWLRSVFDG